MPEKICHTYVITNAANGRKYVGISENVALRLRHHSYGSGLLARAMRLHGKSNFSVETVFSGTRVECCERERNLIVELRTKTTQHGYNIADGGDDPPRKAGADHPLYGKKLSAETIAKIKAARSNQVCSDEQKATYRAIMIGNKRAKRLLSDEQARQIWVRKKSSTSSKLAAEFAVPTGVVCGIWRGDKYSCVQEDAKFDDGVNTSTWMEPTPVRMCEVNGCDRKTQYSTKQYCEKHLTRFHRHGDPLIVKRRSYERKSKGNHPTQAL